MRAKDPMHCKPYADKFGVEFVPGEKCWGVKDVDVYMPAAMQNDVKMESAEKIAKSGVKYYIEVANMPTTNDALNFLREQKHMIVAPSKAVNAGGVGVSGLEMAQNSERLVWTAEEVDAQLHKMMKNIHKVSAEAAEEYGLVTIWSQAPTSPASRRSHRLCTSRVCSNRTAFPDITINPAGFRQRDFLKAVPAIAGAASIFNRKVPEEEPPAFRQTFHAVPRLPDSSTAEPSPEPGLRQLIAFIQPVCRLSVAEHGINLCSAQNDSQICRNHVADGTVARTFDAARRNHIPERNPVCQQHAALFLHHLWARHAEHAADDPPEPVLRMPVENAVSRDLTDGNEPRIRIFDCLS